MNPNTVGYLVVAALALVTLALMISAMFGKPPAEPLKTEPGAEVEPAAVFAEKKSETFGVGCLVQLLALGLGGAVAVYADIFFGGLMGLMGLMLGARLARGWVCGRCRNKLSSGEVKMCPVCHAELQRRS